MSSQLDLVACVSGGNPHQQVGAMLFQHAHNEVADWPESIDRMKMIRLPLSGNSSILFYDRSYTFVIKTVL